MVLPAATAMYCLPSTMYVIGPPFQLWPVLKCHSGLPVCASTATKAPLPSP